MYPIYTSGTTIGFNESVTYVCEDGYFFDEDINLENFTLMCLPGGSWEDIPIEKFCIHPEGTYKFNTISFLLFFKF